MEGVGHGLVDRILHRRDNRGGAGILVTDQVIQHGELWPLAHFLGSTHPRLSAVPLDDKGLAVSVLKLPPYICEPYLGDILLQEFGILPTELQVLAHVLDAVLYRVRHIQGQIHNTKTRKLPIGG